MKSHLMLERYLIFVSWENSATLFSFWKGRRAWHSTVFWCRDHLMVVLCSAPGSAAPEKLHQLLAARTSSVNAASGLLQLTAIVAYRLIY